MAEDDAGSAQSKPGGKASVGGSQAADDGSGEGQASRRATSQTSRGGSTRADTQDGGNPEEASDSSANPASRLGTPADDEPEGDEAEPIQDCVGCPPMLAVPAGSTTICAPPSDLLATDAKRPQRLVRFWQGFLISAAPIMTDSFERFLAETNPDHAACSGPAADLKPATGKADAYVALLTVRTGKRFRLPTATEWEYAARVLPWKGLITGQVVEIVASCWQRQIPQVGLEMIVAQSGVYDCNRRMLKGADPSDEARWHRPSARRRIGSKDQQANVGFRVMR